jgi:VanZ family protein
MSPNAALSPARIAALVVPPLAVMAVIFLLSGQPSDNVDRAWWDFLLRKLAHVTEYAVLTLLSWRALRGLGVKRALAAAVLVSLAYSCTDEFHQTFVDGRHGTPVDVLIDSIGMAIAALAILRATANPRPLAADRRVGERLERAR